MAGALADINDGVTLYQEFGDLPLKDGVGEFYAAGTSLENENLQFTYTGKLELVDGGVIVTLYSGEVDELSLEGGSSAYHVEALDEAAKTIILTRVEE
mgnify:CR=1 FL=1